MSSPTRESELKGGHAPAVKAGGMRVAQHKPPKHEGAPADLPDENEQTEENEETAVATPAANDARLLISGVVAKGDKDFPPEAIKAYHDKPQPCHEKPHAHSHHSIQQPRK